MPDTQHHADLLITNGIVLTLNDRFDVIENGAVASLNDRIVSVGPVGEFDRWQIARKIDARGGIIMPGLINTHTHAAMTCFRGLADDLPLMTWLTEYIFPAEAKLSDDIVYAGSLLACAEMILSGTTCFCDMYLFEDSVARAAKNANVRAVVGEVLYDFPSPNYGNIESGFEYTQNLLDKWRDDPLIRIAVEPHSTYLCAPDLLIRANEISQKNDIPLIIHLSESQSEVSEVIEKYGTTPIRHLDNLGILSPQLLACHCVVVSDDDMQRLKRCDVKVAHNPESNMKLASGVAPVPRMITEGICVSLGTDGCSSNNNLDLFLEMDTAAKLHKVNTYDPTVMDARTVLKMCTIDAARALGIGDITGSIEIGKCADIIVIDTKKPHLTPMYNPESHLVYAVRGSDVQTVIINGVVVMEDRTLNTIDIEKTMNEVNGIARMIRS